MYLLSRSSRSHQHWLPCHDTENASDNNSIVYDCIKSDLQPNTPDPAPKHQARIVADSLRSTHSLSTKYSENKTQLRKTGSLCVRSSHDQVGRS